MIDPMGRWAAIGEKPDYAGLLTFAGTPYTEDAAKHGPVGVVHFDTHTDTGEEVFGVRRSHGTFMRSLLDDGHVDSRRYAQIGLRGYWPGEREFEWQRERGITSLFMHDVRELGTQVGTADSSSLVADRIVREALTGVALRRRAAHPSAAVRAS
jgi:arginase family enzyme